MRMAELSAESGVPVATVKFYLREGLLPAGERTSPNQARYSAAHVQRLRLIKALTDVGGLSLAAVGSVLAAIDAEGPHSTLGVVQAELVGDAPEVPRESADWAFELFAGICERNGWDRPKREHPVVANLVSAMATARELGHPELLTDLEKYTHLAMRVAELDLETVRGLTSVDRIVETGAIAMVLGDRIFTELRHLAQELASREVLRD